MDTVSYPIGNQTPWVLRALGELSLATLKLTQRIAEMADSLGAVGDQQRADGNAARIIEAVEQFGVPPWASATRDEITAWLARASEGLAECDRLRLAAARSKTDDQPTVSTVSSDGTSRSDEPVSEQDYRNAVVRCCELVLHSDDLLSRLDLPNRSGGVMHGFRHNVAHLYQQAIDPSYADDARAASPTGASSAGHS